MVSTVLGLLFRRPLVGTSVIPLLEDGRIVLVKRRDDGSWGLPGGLIDWGEDLATAVRRELKEETGLDIRELGRLVGVYSSPDRDPRVHSICIAVEARVSGTFHIEDGLEIEAVQAFEPDAIALDELAHDHKHQLKDYFSGLTALS